MVGDAHRGIRDRPPALPSLGAPHRGQYVLENSGLTIFWRQNNSDSSFIVERIVIMSSWPGHPLQSSLGRSLHRSRSSVDWYLQLQGQTFNMMVMKTTMMMTKTTTKTRTTRTTTTMTTTMTIMSTRGPGSAPPLGRPLDRPDACFLVLSHRSGNDHRHLSSS